MLPFFIYYSMFGFQRVGDFIWQAADARARGFLLGATAGRTTLNGEGLQHQDGHSNLIAISNPAVIAWDPAFAYELSYIIEDGIQKMWGEDKDLIYYISVYNENHPMPAVPEITTCGLSAKEACLKGLYKFQEAPADKPITVRLIGTGSIMQQVLGAIDLLAEYGVGCEIWSATNIGELHREAYKAERYARLHPLEPPPGFWVKDCLGDFDGVTVLSSDNISQYGQLLDKYVGGDFVILGTDGFGRSDTREKLRRFFEIDSESVAVAALSQLARQGKVAPQVAADAIEKFGIKHDRPDICMDGHWP
jgi:pyruvate dehydrogenase E1 component